MVVFVKNSDSLLLVSRRKALANQMGFESNAYKSAVR